MGVRKWDDILRNPRYHRLKYSDDDGEPMNEEAEFSARAETTVRKLLAKVNRVPFLFVGSGLSMRYMDTENWRGLLEWVCESVGEPMKPFYSYMQQARTEQRDSVNELYPRIATLMERDFVLALDNPAIVGWAQRHVEGLNAGIPAMKIYIADHLSEAHPDGDNAELRMLQKASRHVAGVITTNYDRLMEDHVFPGYQAYVRQEDLLFSQLTGIGEIYKIHGSVEDPDSMILDEKDYKHLAERQQYLLSKILTIFGEYPIIFLGYSMRDQDIRDIITAIAQCAGERRVREMSERFIFVEHSNTPEIQTAIYDVGSQNVEMTRIGTSDFTPIYKAIAATNMKYAPKVLRQITQQLYEASYTGGEATQVVFADLQDLDELPQDKEIVVGVGIKNYGRVVKLEDMHVDVLFENKHFSPILIASEYLEKYSPQGTPMYYYLSRYDGPLSDKVREAIEKKKCVDDYLSPTQKKWRERSRKKYNDQDWSIVKLKSRFGYEAYKHLYMLNQQEYNLDDLEEMLKEITRKAIEEKKGLDTDIRKAIRIYDYLKYGMAYLRER